MLAEITPKLVMELRQRTGVGMMECKKALAETNGDLDLAIESLRKRGAAKAASKADRAASEGLVEAYIHPGGRVGVLLEINCETDFVARTDDFKNLVKGIAMHIAAMGPDWVSEEHVPDEFLEGEKRVFEQEVADKPENIRGKIVEGKIKKRLEDVVLLAQEHVNPKHEGRTIEQLRADISQKTGENVVIRRFQRFAVGEA